MTWNDITEKELTQLKQLYPDVPLYKRKGTSSTGPIVFRALTREIVAEVKALVLELREKGQTMDFEEIDELVVRRCIVWPELTDEFIDSWSVGAIPSYSKAINERSGHQYIDSSGRVWGPDVGIHPIQEPNLWGLPDADEIEKLKATHQFLVQVKVGPYVFVVRPLTRADMRFADEADDRDEAMMLCSVVWPGEVDWAAIPVGIFNRLGQQINALSGWDIDVEIEEL